MDRWYDLLSAAERAYAAVASLRELGFGLTAERLMPEFADTMRQHMDAMRADLSRIAAEYWAALGRDIG